MFDRTHAARIFVDNNFGLSPKYGWLFHVAFDLNPEIARVSNDNKLRMGLVVKSASLPKFTVETKTMNAYNRVDIVQTKVKYDSVSIKFHDDNLDVVRNFWYDYYSYYYRDSDWNESIYAAPTKYSERQNQIWGYTPRQYPASSPGTQQFLNAIRIYSLHNKKFAEYTLINPTITQFQHGEHAQGGEAGTLENTMTVQFQAVKYAYGQVSEDTVSGFAMLQYDTRPSELGTTNITDRTVHDLSEGLTGLPGILNNLKNLNGGAILGGALGTIGSGLLAGGIDKGIGMLAGAGGISAIAGSAKDLLSKGKDKLGKVFSNGEKVDFSKIGFNDGLPSDPVAASTNQQAAIDQVSAQISADEDAITQAKQTLADNQSAQQRLQAQIEADTYNLEYDPNLSEADIAALEQIILDNKSQLSQLQSDEQGIKDHIDGLTSTVLDNQYKLGELQRAQNPSGNDAADGGPGPNSTTTTDAETGATTQTNPDGSSTTVEQDGAIHTEPQQKAVDNPTASSNQMAPVYTGPRVVYAPDGSSSPVDELGNVQRSLINGSYNH
jgi:hypothetical protein